MPSKKVKATKRAIRKAKNQITFSPVPENLETMSSPTPHSSTPSEEAQEILTEVRLAIGPHTPYQSPTGSPLAFSLESLAIQSPKPKENDESNAELIPEQKQEEEAAEGSKQQQAMPQGKPYPHQRDNPIRYHPYRRPLLDFPHAVFNPSIPPPPIPLRLVRVPDLRVRFAHLFGPDGRFLI